MERLSKEQIEAVIQEAKERCPYYGEPDGCNAHGGPLMCCDELDEVGELAKAACALGTVEELSALVKARDKGRVVLPCRIGENVYYIFPKCGGYFGYFVSEPYKVTEVGTKGFWTSDILDEQPDAMSVFAPWSDFGKTVFLTRAEAEAAIGGGGDG